MRGARPPAVAGSFYPSDPATLAATVDRLLADAGPLPDAPQPGPSDPPYADPASDAPPALDGPTAEPPPDRPPLRALVVPHAGYPYSGPVAATAFARLRPDPRRRVVALGPSHWVPVREVAASDAAAWRTPLGDVPLDPPPAGVPADRSVHAREHALEVQLPFLQRLRDDLRFLPLAVGGGPADAAADLLEPLWADPSVVLLCSTDLSHYLDRASAQRRDRRTADAVVARDVEALGPDDACGVHALRALLVLARRHGASVELLDLRTSADTAGDPGRVVGYGAFAVSG